MSLICCFLVLNCRALSSTNQRYSFRATLGLVGRFLSVSTAREDFRAPRLNSVSRDYNSLSGWHNWWRALDICLISDVDIHRCLKIRYNTLMGLDTVFFCTIASIFNQPF